MEKQINSKTKEQNISEKLKIFLYFRPKNKQSCGFCVALVANKTRFVH